MLDPDEVASVVPDSEKTLSVSSFVGCGDVDDIYFDKPYYLSPTDPHAEEAYALIREGMRKEDGGPRANRAVSACAYGPDPCVFEHHKSSSPRG